MRNISLHHVCKAMRDLRHAGGYSLQAAAEITGVPDIVIGSYERGDRHCNLEKAEQILNGYGYTLAAIAKDFDAVRLPADNVAELRAIADALERQSRRSAE